MSKEFQLIKSLQLKESSDHYTILLLKEGSNICQPLPQTIVSHEIQVICRFFEIPYHKEWSYGGDQIEIPKQKEDLKIE